MCLAIPMKVIRIEGETALVESGGIEQQIGIHLVPDVQINDYVIVHAGFAIQKMDEAFAQETIQLFEEMRRVQ
jgi:hydrogenase expression/formation protein HypC